MKKTLSAFTLTTVLIGAALFAFAQSRSTSAALDNMKAGKVIVVSFTADYCKPCKAFHANVLAPVAAEWAGNTNVVVAIVDVEKDSPTASGRYFKDMYGISVLPSTVVISNGRPVYVLKGGYRDASEAGGLVNKLNAMVKANL
jgi:thiol-disulfide isomerase/thioredoxin